MTTHVLPACPPGVPSFPWPACLYGPHLAGTCVNVGCVPKKVMWNAAHVREMLGGAGHFGFKVNGDISFDWHFLKTARDDYIKRLNSIYGNNLKNSKVELLQGVR